MRRAVCAGLSAAWLVACGAPPERPPATIRTRGTPQAAASSDTVRDEPAPEPVAEAPSHREPAEVFVLPTSGIRVVYRHRGGVPRVTLGVLLQTEADASPPVRALHGGLLLEATGDADSDAWFRDLGVHVRRSAGPNGEMLSITTVTPLFKAVVDHVGANVTTPVLGGPRVAAARARLRLGHDLAHRHPSTRALGAATGALLPGARYDAWYAAISPAAIDAVNLDQLRSFHAQTAVSERMVLSVVGPISKEEVMGVLDRAFAGIRHGSPVREPSASAEPPPPANVLVLDDPGVNEAFVMCALRGPDPRDGDATQARAEAAAWSRSVFGSLRLRHGASYIAHSSWLPLRGASLLFSEASVAPTDAGLAVRSMKESFERRAQFAAAPPAREREQQAADDAIELALGLRLRPRPAAPRPPLDASRALFVVVGDAKSVGPSLAAAGLPFEVRPRD
jgi:hypothetical protein